MNKQNEALDTGDIQLLTLILSENQCHKCVHLLKERGVLGGMVIIGRGTVSSAILNALGIKNQRKEIVKILLDGATAKEVVDYVDEVLQLKKHGHGIAYTTPVIGAVGIPEQAALKKDSRIGTVQGAEGECMFKKLTVIVDRGMANDVMDIARKAGVRGGTILHGRGAGTDIATSLFGVEIEPEKELVIILTPNDLVDRVVEALTQGLQLDQPGKGILFIEPILDTRGLYEMSNKK